MELIRIRQLLVLVAITSGVALISESPNVARAADADPEARLGLPEEPIPLAELPECPRPLIEWGEGHLEPSQISKGWTLPTGAVWPPPFLLWGSARSAFQAETGKELDQAQWVNEFERFGQLALTSTERFVVSPEPFQGGNEFSGYRFGLDDAESEFASGFDFTPVTLFFEGAFGELFPRLDRSDGRPLDLGFMVGRVPILFQYGFLIDDRMTAFGLVQNSIPVVGTSNLRISLITAWDGVHRGDKSRGGDSLLVGLFSELDRAQATWAVDAVYVDGDHDSDGLFGGVSAIRRIRGRWNLSSRLLGSYGLGDGLVTEVEGGLLGVMGFSFAPQGTLDVAYVNLIAAAGPHYRPAARSADEGGPLGPVEILFEAPGLGSSGLWGGASCCVSMRLVELSGEGAAWREGGVRSSSSSRAHRRLL
ncbi:MAG: hypothetical protein CL933_14330 [Deltaproteobacteria bacterium]|nr:hypothetical protein [Deltaproteobacteria bacterium]